MTLAELNASSAREAERALAGCCGSSNWAAAMARQRPFASLEQLLVAAERLWWDLSSPDWLEAFSHHPRIGDRAAGWASQEQAGTVGASQETLDALVRWNADYERRFGFVFLIFATGKSADEMLAELKRRAQNERTDEIRIAAGEQAKITRLRLGKLLAN